MCIREVDDSRSDRIDDTIGIVYFEEDHRIWWTLFEYLEESILSGESRRGEVSEYVYVFSLIGYQVYIPDTLSSCRDTEFFFILRDIVDEYVHHMGIYELLI